PGRPVTWVTTEAFLAHFGLESCDALPGVEELRAAGLLDSRNNSATLGVQGTLPPGGEAAEEDDEADDEADDEKSAGIADDEYEAGVLARLEGAEPALTEDAAADVATIGGEAALDDDLDVAELPDTALEAEAEAEAGTAEERDDPDIADIEEGVLPDELLDEPEDFDEPAEKSDGGDAESDDAEAEDEATHRQRKADAAD